MDLPQIQFGNATSNRRVATGSSALCRQTTGPSLALSRGLGNLVRSAIGVVGNNVVNHHSLDDMASKRLIGPTCGSSLPFGWFVATRVGRVEHDGWLCGLDPLDGPLSNASPWCLDLCPGGGPHGLDDASLPVCFVCVNVALWFSVWVLA